jgi:ribosomal protein S18 acetylase RimI-like enzyme
VSDAEPADYVAALELLFRHFPPDETTNRIATALPLLLDAARHRLNLLVVREDRAIVGAMLIQALPGGTGVVWPPQADLALTEDELIRAALAWLRDRGARLAQALLSPDEVSLAAPLLRHGFANPTRLWYLRHDLLWPQPLSDEPVLLTYEPYQDGNRDTFHRALLRSYGQTQDFPELNGLRSLEEVLHGHQAAGFDPGRWLLARLGNEAVGVLVLTDAEEPGDWELAYVGVLPEARGRGWGRELVRHALGAATTAGARSLTLSVDARNEPAWKIYRHWGFEPYAAREVFLATW